MEGWKSNKGVLQYQNLTYIPEIICSELISCHHNDTLTRHFEIDKIQELVAKKYYWPTFHHNVETYMRRCNIYLASKAVHHKSYGNLQLLLILTHY